MSARPLERSKALNLCSVFAKNAGEEPIGSAWSTVRTLLVELPLPWPYSILEARHVPAGVAEAVYHLYEQHADWGMIAIAPDPDYAPDDRVRIIDLNFGPFPRSNAFRRDILVDRDQTAAAISAITNDTPLPESTSIDHTPYRDLLVCTHGSIDVCCGTFGYPAYRHLKALTAHDPRTRIWRSSHFGGHRFAPTMLDLPDGRYWGFMDETAMNALLHHGDPIESLRGCYRGWAGYEHPSEQLLERECFFREGWQWLEWPQASSVLERDDQGEPLRLAIIATLPTSDIIRYEGRVETVREIETMDQTGGDLVTKRIHRIADLKRTMFQP